MKAAPLLKNDEERIKELESYQILDTEPEIAFDEITELASRLCETPISLVSLVDGQRQWFKSKVGLEAPETPRDISFCGHAIEKQEIFEVSNSLEDSRFSDNPLVTGEPKVIFYAGIPLTNSKGLSLGTLCVIDQKPKELSENQRRQLEILGHQVVAQMELRRSNLQLRDALKEVDSQKMAAIENAKILSLGQMAGGVAHEINNPLGIIQLLSMSIQECLKTKEYDIIEEKCQKIDKTVTRISKIISTLRSIYRDQKNDHLQEVDLNEIIGDTLTMCNEKFRNQGIEIRYTLQPEVKIMCRPGEISQVLVNLLSNSFDAILNTPNPWIEIQVQVKNNSAVVSIIDSGTSESIPEDYLDPFITTKDAGKGTGLGLSISKNIVEKHQGNIQLDRNHQNTKFDLSFPQAGFKKGVA